jgi:hypothetical protein
MLEWRRIVALAIFLLGDPKVGFAIGDYDCLGAAIKALVSTDAPEGHVR